MTAQQDPEIVPFSKFIGALDPWLEQMMVLIGGWARNLEYLPLTTLDGDVAMPTKLKVEESNVRKRLLEAGFHEEFVGEGQPPATHDHYRESGGFYVEFLSPLVGSEYDRSGRHKATKEVGGVFPNCFVT
jgi:hypothetical protein